MYSMLFLQCCLQNSSSVGVIDLPFPRKTITHFHFLLFILVVLSAFIQKKYFFASDLSSSGLCHVALLFTNEEQRKTGSWCIWCFCHKCCPCSWHHDDTDCWAQNGNAHTSHSCIFTTFKENIGETPERPGGAHYGLFRVHRYHLKLNSKPQICNKQDHKLSEKLLDVCCHSIPVDRACEFLFTFVPL